MSTLNPIGNQVAAAARQQMADQLRQAQQSVQLSDFTHIEQTEGTGVFRVQVMFDVWFTQEPVHKHGMTIPDRNKQTVLAVTDVPNVNSFVESWITEYGLYKGANMLIIVRVPEGVPVIT